MSLVPCGSFFSLMSPSSLLLEEQEEEEDTSVSEVNEFSLKHSARIFFLFENIKSQPRRRC